MKIVTSAEMKRIDAHTIGHYGIAGAVLMERAGTGVARVIKDTFEPCSVIVLAGHGNNGGDGFVIARELRNAGFDVTAVMAGSKNRLTPGCKAQMDTARKMGVRVEMRSKLASADLKGRLIVDALLGTGLSKEIKEPFFSIVEAVNASRSPVVSVDIPSGVSSDTGEVLGTAIQADITVTFGAPKIGHFIHPGAENTGKLIVEDIGFPPEVFQNINTTLLEQEDMRLLVPERPTYCYKSTFGHAVVIAGSAGKTGAAFLSTGAVMRSGAGLATLMGPESLAAVYQERVTEAMTMFLPDTGMGSFALQGVQEALDFLHSNAEALILGPGLGLNEDTIAFAREVAMHSPVPVVLDADGLNAVSGVRGFFSKNKSPLVLTPHPGEFARLSGQSINDIENSRVESARAFAKKTGTCLVLKGVPTVIAEPDGQVMISNTGTPGMATAGSGDVLAGIIGGFISQGLSPLEASLVGAYIHGMAGEIASEHLGNHAMIASDIINALPDAFLALGRGEHE